MLITASISNSYQKNIIEVSTDEKLKHVEILSKENGYGSSISGGELLLLALATCYCNDVYREADKMNIKVNSVKVDVTGEFGGVGMPGRKIFYSVDIEAPHHTIEEINLLVNHVDKVAEIHNTLRQGVNVSLKIQ